MLPLLQAHLPRSVNVLVKYLNLLKCELGIVDVKVGFIIVAEGAVFEVRRSRGDEILVHDEQFNVIHRRLILVNLRARLKKISPKRTGSSPDDWLLNMITRYDDLNPHSTLRCCNQSLHRCLVGNKVSGGNPNKCRLQLRDHWPP